MDLTLISNYLRSDALLQKEAIEYFERLKSDQNGWKLCVECLVKSQVVDDSAIFFCLQVIEHYIKTRYSSDSEDNRTLIRQFIFHWFNTKHLTLNYIENKFAYIVNSVFLVDFPLQKWNTFFTDILSLCQNQENCDLFLRILLQINADVADREIPRSQKELERNTLIKDLMRETCLLELAQFWFNVINTYRDSSPNTVCLCLEVIGSYVSWIDISLITNDSIMTNLFNLFPFDTFRCSVTDCFNGILHKGMDSLAKTQLIQQFMSVESIKQKLTQIFNTSIVCDTDENNNLFVIKFSKLMNTIGIELIEALKKFKSKSSLSNNCIANGNLEDLQALTYISTAIESKFNILCQFLSHKNNLVSLQIHPFTREYIQWAKNTLTKKENNVTVVDKALEEKLLIFLRIIIEKCKYPMDHDFSLEEETTFDEFRKSCKVLFDNLMLLNSSVVIQSICSQLIEPLLMNWRISGNNYTFADIEICLYYFYLMGENLNFLNDTKRIELLLQLLITSSISTFPHTCTQSIYFDLILRYEKYFANNLNYLVPQILISFLDERGFKNRSLKMRSKVALMFNKFVKSQIKSKGSDKQQNFTEDILKRLQDFLKLDVIPSDSDLNETNGLISNKNKTPNIFDEIRYSITTEDQLNVYETVAILIITNQNFDTNRKQFLMKTLLINTIWDKFEEIYSKLSNEINAQNGKIMTDSNEFVVKQYCTQISHIISLTSRTSKAFSNIITIKSVGLHDIYLQSFNIFIKPLSLGLNEDFLFIIQSTTRQFLHRCIVCLDESDIVPLLPSAIQSLFLLNQQLNYKTLQELIPLLNQVVTKFKHSWLFQRDLTPFFKQIFKPLIHSFFTVISQTVNNEEKLSIQKSYYTLLSLLVTNNIMEPLVSIEVPLLEQIMITVFQGAIDFPDVVTQKICFQILRKFIEFFAESNEVSFDSNGKAVDTKLVKNIGSNEFAEFIYKSIIPACFVAPIRHNEDSQLVNECITCLKAIQTTRGTQELSTYLSSQFFPQHFPNYSNCCELIQTLMNNDVKTTKRLFKIFCQQFKQNINEIT
ncbi:exportin-T-like [Oppia nitens]|uniref:exportin-T-like n=1 Tax=Oppia nitens TaxID=1686743 RepID=UPI0023DAF49D|nr:exportin-T-like [Oppia nitens]